MSYRKESAFPLSERFRGFLPVVIDIETGGFNAATDGILELGAVFLDSNEEGNLEQRKTLELVIEPFDGANLEPSALEFTGIDPSDPNREAISEADAIQKLVKTVRNEVKRHDCTRAILVGHNAHFDHGFLRAAMERCTVKRDPFHPFSSFDTATLAGLAYGQTVLAKSCQIAGINFDNNAAHSAAYDAEKTAELFCMIVNHWQALGGWPINDNFL